MQKLLPRLRTQLILLFHLVLWSFLPITSSHLQSNQTGIFYIILSTQEVQYKSLYTDSRRKSLSPVGGLPIHSLNINTGRATYRNASMLLILFLCLIIGLVAGQQYDNRHHPNGIVCCSTPKQTPSYTSSKESTTSIESLPWTRLKWLYRRIDYDRTASTTSTNQYHPRSTVTSALPETTSTENSTPVFPSPEDYCFFNSDQNSCPVGYKSVGGLIVARDHTTDSGYSTAFPTLSKSTRTRVPCKYAPCTQTGPHECDPHPENHCGNGRPYLKRRTTSSALAQITSTEHLNQLGPGSTASSLSRKSQCLNNLKTRPNTTSRPVTTLRLATPSSGPFLWWIYYMILVNRPSKESATSSTLAQNNSTDNSLFYPGNTPATFDFLDFLLRIINMASKDRDDSFENTPNSSAALSKSDCESRPADILTPYTNTDKNPLDDLGPNPESPVLSAASNEGMVPDEPMHPRGQASDSTPKKAELGTKPAPDSTPTKMVRVVSQASDATSTRPEQFARSPSQQKKSSSSSPEKPPPKSEPPKCDRCGKTGFPGFCPYCSNMNKDGVGMF